MALRVTDLKIDPKSLGNLFLLVDVVPAYAYADGKRTDTITGYKYVCALPSHKLEKIAIKIENVSKLVEWEDGDDARSVTFENLEVGTYFRNGSIELSVKATSIHEVV